mmetsp:Transcript_30596/g.77030  ORF Transcript_30596/g.77030 Transcript_30596/m.77030 type:complete len:158 (+) Transcript_30596:189-662(+)
MGIVLIRATSFATGASSTGPKAIPLGNGCHGSGLEGVIISKLFDDETKATLSRVPVGGVKSSEFLEVLSAGTGRGRRSTCRGGRDIVIMGNTRSGALGRSVGGKSREGVGGYDLSRCRARQMVDARGDVEGNLGAGRQGDTVLVQRDFPSMPHESAC